MVDVARAAEKAGWEGFFVWDHLGFVSDAPSSDPWIDLATVGTSTSRLVLGTAETPLARYGPQRLASLLVSLNQLAASGLVFGAGLGGVSGECSAFGEPAFARERADRLDEALEVLTELMSGEVVDHSGKFYRIDEVKLDPLPRPRVPIWIGESCGPALRRASPFDEWIANSTGGFEMTMSPDEFPSRRTASRPAQYRGSIRVSCRRAIQSRETTNWSDPMRRPERPGGWSPSTISERRSPEMMDCVRAGPV